MKQEEQIFSQAFEKYISPSRYEKMLNNSWCFEIFPFGGRTAKRTIERIGELLKNRNKVICGYMATSVREYHDHFIIYKKQK